MPMFFSIRQAADEVSLSTRTLRRYHAQGILKFHRTPNGEIRIRPKDLAALIPLGY